MSKAKTIIAELRPSLQRTGLVVGIVLMIMIGAGLYNAHMLKAKQTTEQAFQGTVQNYRAILQSEQILRTETTRFEALRAQGFVGQEPRLRWVEDVRDSAKQAGLDAIHYELEPREAYASSIATGNLQLFSSQMRLRLGLLHEGDLLKFLQLLEARHSGIFELNACTLQHSHNDAEIHLHDSNILALCELRWYSLDHAVAASTEDAP